MKDTLPDRVRLGLYVLDLRAGELRAGDETVLLREQPLQVLRMLVERDGDILTREEIQKKLWPNDTVVEFDHSINSAIRNLRRALNDSADNPKYIETLARRGYRLMVPVEWLGNDDLPDKVSTEVGGTAVRSQPEPGLTGKKVSHYRVLDIIGGGGMGVVYRAEDLKLGRQVALKFLPEELAWDELTRRRFEREARAASSLDHPNICTIYEVDEHEEQPFLVMQLLDGETLRDRLTAESESKSTLPVEELLHIAVGVSQGLQAAHEKGIIHRDIKPANIFLTTGGQVKILDFGIAKLVKSAKDYGSDELRLGTNAASLPATSGSADTPITRLGATLGTAGYMSPEQVRGEKLDARTDLFSFGLVLYEMATGKRAFSGETQTAVKQAILNNAQVPVRELNSTLPPQLEPIIAKALEKSRRRRYQSAAELRTDLTNIWRDMAARDVVPTQAAKQIGEAEKKGLQPAPEKEPTRAPQPRRWGKWVAATMIVAIALAVGLGVGYRTWRPSVVEANASIAVLPFGDLSPGHDEEYFSDGLTEQLIIDLARIPGLKVIALSSAFQFKGKNVDPRQVGRVLNVANILEGSVSKEGDRVRINVELTKAADGFQLWSHSYDLQMGDIFAMQDEIARDVASELRVKLTGADGAPLARANPTTTPDAYEAYLQGRYFSRHHEPGDYKKALAFADEAIRLDPKYAPAWALRSYVLSSLAVRGEIDNADGFRRARENAQAAIALDPALADAYLELVLIQVFHDFDVAGAEINLRKAAELEPSNVEVYMARATIAQAEGKLDEAMNLEKKIIAIDPLRGYAGVGFTLYNQGKYDEALAALQMGQGRARFCRGAILLAQNHPEQALAEMQLEADEAFRLAGEAIVYYALGDHEDSDNSLDELIGNYGKDSAYQVAQAYAYRNQADKAFEWLERAYEQRDGAMINIKIDPLLKNLRQDPRYAQLLRKMNL